MQTIVTKRPLDLEGATLKDRCGDDVRELLNGVLDKYQIVYRWEGGNRVIFSGVMLRGIVCYENDELVVTITLSRLLALMGRKIKEKVDRALDQYLIP